MIVAPDLTRLDSGRGHSGLRGGRGGGYRANVLRLPQMHVKRDSEAPLARTLREEDTCAFAFPFPVCNTVKICRPCGQAREATGILLWQFPFLCSLIPSPRDT